MSFSSRDGDSREIVKVLLKECFDIKIINAKEEKNRDISEYVLIIVGNSLQIGKLTSEANDFLRKSNNELEKKNSHSSYHLLKQRLNMKEKQSTRQEYVRLP